MVLIADGGSTKVEWCVVNKGVVEKKVISEGLNPFIRTYEEIYKEININVIPLFKDFSIDTIYFFGTGCLSLSKNDILKKAIVNNLNVKNIFIESDLVGAAKGLLGNNSGIVGILGTGSNSCFYDGNKITEQIPPLGYIIGDEGSGAVLGKIFLNACLKNQLTKGIKEKFLENYNLTIPEILDKVYHQSMPNRFLGTIFQFMTLNIQDDSVYELIKNSLSDFFIKNIMQYDYKNHSVHLTGSVAYVLEELVRHVAAKLSINIENIVQTPMDGLVKYYDSIL